MRKLASIQVIQDLRPIPGADAIEVATVQGWTVVVKKGEFLPGSPCVFMEVDSLLPEAPWSEFMRSKGFRVKTIKLRGQLSQGLALPLEVVGARLEDHEIGEDISELIGVRKFEIPENPQHVQCLGVPFPSHVPKTDEERVQSAPELLTAMQGRPYVMTVKLDGSSMTATYDADGKFHVCSRNLSLNPPEEGDTPTNYWKVAGELDLKGILAGTTIAIQGELCGPSIQKNRLGLSSLRFFAFNAYDWAARRPLSPSEFLIFCTAKSIPAVPLEEEGDLFSYTQSQLLEKANGFYAGTKNRREGIVFRTNDDGPRVSLKAISNEFLLKDES